ncbi:MAG: hypothetical protein KGI89_17150 [Euryarchaeota archaeon]|nr:hypothetical protein [Euryarchaeota archaeon]
MAPRKSWEQLSPGYRRRLEAQGVDRAYHERGDLRAARGHSGLPRGRYPAPWPETQAVIRGDSTAAQDALLRRWWDKGHAPVWFYDRAPDGGYRLSWDSAAAISAQVYSAPETWDHVDILRTPGGQWFMSVYFSPDDDDHTDVFLPPGTEQEVIDWVWHQDGVENQPLDLEVGYSGGGSMAGRR